VVDHLAWVSIFHLPSVAGVHGVTTWITFRHVRLQILVKAIYFSKVVLDLNTTLVPVDLFLFENRHSHWLLQRHLDWPELLAPS
jgi:hypothetical protein